MGAKIILGVQLPKDWRLNLILQKDETYQKMLKEWDQTTDPEKEKMLRKMLDEYEEKVRADNNLPKPE